MKVHQSLQLPLAKRRQVLAGAAAGLASLTLPFISARAADTPLVLTVAESSKNGPRPRLIAADLLRDLPYQIKWVEYDTTPKTLEALRSGAVDLGYGGDTGVIFSLAGSRESNVAVVLALMMTDNLDGGVLVSKTSDVKSIGEMKGKRIAVAPGTGSQYMLIQWLNKAGLQYTDITPVQLQPADALVALSSGQIDGWAVSEPFLSVATVNYGARIITTGVLVNGSISIEFANTKALEDPAKSAAIRDFLRRVIAAQTWIDGHPKEWATALAVATGQPPAVAAAGADRARRVPVPIGSKVIDQVQQESDLFYSLHILPKPITVAPAFDPRFNDLIPKT